MSIMLQPSVLLSTGCVRSGCMYLYAMCISFTLTHCSHVVCSLGIAAMTLVSSQKLQNQYGMFRRSIGLK